MTEREDRIAALETEEPNAPADEKTTPIPPTSFGAGFYARGDDPRNYPTTEHAAATNRHERRRADALLRKTTS